MNNKLYQIEIKDPKNLKGDIFIEILNYLSNDLANTKVLVRGVEGAGVAQFCSEMKLEELLVALQNVVQLDWGDFFFIEKNCEFSLSKTMSFPEIIKNSSISIRAIDSTYVNIFTNKEKTKNKLNRKYKTIVKEKKQP